jgi:hypothetical protein
MHGPGGGRIITKDGSGPIRSRQKFGREPMKR